MHSLPTSSAKNTGNVSDALAAKLGWTDDAGNAIDWQFYHRRARWPVENDRGQILYIVPKFQ